MERQSKVLVVDDDQFTLRSIAKVLGGESYQVVTAPSGSEALDLLRQGSFDLVLTDLKMPEVDGLEVLRQVKKIAPQAVVLMLTGHASVESAIEALREGAYDYLVKPCSGDELRLKIERGLERVRLVEERKRAEEALRRRAGELDVLQATVLDITARHDLPTLLQTIVERAALLLNAPGGGLYLCDPDQEETRCVVSYNTPRDYTGTVLKYGEGAAGIVAQTGEPLIIDDYHTWSGRAAAYEEEQPFTAVLSVPMMWRGQVTGVIHVLHNVETRRFTQADLELLTLFANHAAISVENARLYESERKRSAELETLRQASLRLTSTLELQPILEAILDHALKLVAADDAHVFLYDGERLAFGAALWASAHQQEPYSKPRLHGLTYTAARSGECIVVPDVNSHPLFRDYPWGGGAIIGLPLRIGDRVVGVMNVAFGRPHVFDENELRVLRLLANHAAISVENARLYEETRRRALEQETLREAALALTTALDRDEVIERILVQLQQVVPYDSASVQLLQGDRLVIIGGHGFPNLPDLLGISFRADGNNPNREVMATLSPFILEDASAVYEAFQKGPHVQTAIRSWLGVPLLVGERLVGMVALDKREPGFYTQEHARLAEAFAAQGAIAIENARLFEEIEERRLYLEAVLGAAPDAIVTLDARNRVVEWNSGAERLFGYSREEVIGQDLDHLVTKPDVFEEAVGLTQLVLGGKALPPVETIRYRKDGSPVDILLAGSPIMVGDELIGLVAVYTDITARVRMEETLRALALVDDLTGLYNRRGFLTLSEQQLKAANRAKRRMVLLFADFDDLKWINDTFGHPEGDLALIETADVVRETFRESDIIARIGGDEFVILAIETDGAPAEILATRLQENLEARNAREGRRYKLSLSMGLARYDPERPCSIDELVARADRAMYERKRGNPW